MSLSYCARGVSVVVATLLLSACRVEECRLLSVYGDAWLVCDGSRRPLSPGAAVHQGDVIETADGGAEVSFGSCQRFQVYPRSSVLLSGVSRSCAERWLHRLKAMLAGWGEPGRAKPARVPVIAVRA